MINIIYETIVVGLYSAFVFMICNLFPTDIYTTLFITGFFKHFFGYFSGLHSFYCDSKIKGSKSDISLIDLTFQSIGEGILFICLGKCIGHSFLHILFIGVFLHLLFEILRLHDIYIRNYCH